MNTALDELAAAADEIADDQREVGRQARAMQQRRARGWSWAAILDRAGQPGPFELLRHSARLLATATRHFAAAVARGLRDEGESTRRIAPRLGVTHQRVSALLRDNPPPGAPAATTPPLR